MDGVTLKKWLLKNQLLTIDKDKNKIIPDYITNNNIIVLKNRKFILEPPLNYSSTDNLIK